MGLGLSRHSPHIWELTTVRDGIDEILNLRNEFSIEYKEKRQVLDAKKEASFPLMDLRKWEVDQDNLTVPKTQLFQDKATALKYMFPKDTQDVKNLRDFWAYCNALIGSELREFGHIRSILQMG